MKNWVKTLTFIITLSFSVMPEVQPIVMTDGQQEFGCIPVSRKKEKTDVRNEINPVVGGAAIGGLIIIGLIYAGCKIRAGYYKAREFAGAYFLVGQKKRLQPCSTIDTELPTDPFSTTKCTGN